jgi:photosystem II stability/assembly factor-like uncharacterized protein
MIIQYTKQFLVIISAFFMVHSSAQQPMIKILESGKKVSIRGLSVVDDNTIWASGSGGSVARSTNGGKTFTWVNIPGYEKTDFRDIEAFDKDTAIVMGITTPAVILKTIDGGISWKKVFEDTAKAAFLDAMDFHNEEMGIAFGDPLSNNRFYTIITSSHGNTWSKSDLPYLPDFYPGEAFFASSGTNIRFRNDGSMVAVTGGKKSRLFSWNFHSKKNIVVDSVPMMQGGASTGANSIDVWKHKAVIVGGDFSKDTISSNNCVLVSFERKLAKMTIPQTPPHGYRSCVIYLDENNLLTCGTSGIDISKDGGRNWQLISKESYHVCQKAKKGSAVFLAGSNGRIAKLATL